jgi:hypothetical protein
LRPRALVIEVKQRVLERAGVTATRFANCSVDLATSRPARCCPVANELYRPLEQ